MTIFAFSSKIIILQSPSLIALTLSQYYITIYIKRKQKASPIFFAPATISSFLGVSSPENLQVKDDQWNVLV